MVKNLTPEPTVTARKKINYDQLRDQDRQMVKGIFRNHEVPGGPLSFCYKFYEGDQVVNINLLDGEVATIPLGAAKHLNKNCWYPEYEHHKGHDVGVQGGYGSPRGMRIGKKIKRYSFQSLEFMEAADLNPDPLITVELTQ